MALISFPQFVDIYRITAVFKVETDIVTGFTMSLVEQAVILVIMLCPDLQTDVILLFLSVLNVIL
jgi:hypothetical protein